MSVSEVPRVVFEVFTSPGCVQCEATVRLLVELDAVFGIVEAPEFFDLLREEGFAQVPVVKVYRLGRSGVLDQWQGYRPDRICAHVGPVGRWSA